MQQYHSLVTDLDQLRDDVKRESLAAALAEGESLVVAAKTAGISKADAEKLAYELETIAMVEERSPDVADALREMAAAGDDPLAILERGAKTAAKLLVDKIESGDLSPAVVKQLIELSLKLRAARDDAPTEINIYLPKTHVDPLIAACREFNGLLATLIADAKPSSGVDSVAPA